MSEPSIVVYSYSKKIRMEDNPIIKKSLAGPLLFITLNKLIDKKYRLGRMLEDENYSKQNMHQFITLLVNLQIASHWRLAPPSSFLNWSSWTPVAVGIKKG
jgi:hypothetical protein